MNNTIQTQSLPSLSQLLKATGLAASVATGLLVTVILPVEYGIDPIGTGKALGLTRLRAPAAPKAAEAASPETPSMRNVQNHSGLTISPRC
jgi:hypothetical protein